MFNPQQHTQNGESFALWKSPQSSETKGVVTKAANSFTPNLLQQDLSGFAFAPFNSSGGTEPLFLEGDIKTFSALKGNTSIEHYHLNLADIQTETAENYKQNVGRAVEEITQNKLKKVVIARNTKWEIPENFCLLSFFQSLCKSYPEALVSLVSIKGVGTWIGATPETLLKTNEEHLTTVALAGTQLKDHANWTEKENEEQLWVVRYIEDILEEYQVSNIDISARKRITNGDLEHLYTQIDFRKAGITSNKLATQILPRLHPTPAVGGIGKKEALAFINANEKFDRAYYSGYLGEVNANTIDLFVNLRCMQVTTTSLIGYAGAGITKDSNPEKELQETENKLNNLKSLLNN